MPHRFSVSQWWPLVERYRPTWLNVVPTIISYLLNGPDLTPRRADACRGVRFGRSASAPLPPEQHRAFEQRFGISVIEAMGLTECASVAFANPLDPRKRKYGSPGLPLGVEARVVAPDGTVLGDGRAGRDRAARRQRDAGLLQGARAHRAGARRPMAGSRRAISAIATPTASISSPGRLKELIIKGGENIAPREIDEALLKHPAVLEAAAVGIPDVHYGQEILACVVLKPGAECSRGSVARALSARARALQDAQGPSLRRRPAQGRRRARCSG